MIKIFFEGDHFFSSLEKDIKLSKKYIFIEFYIFQLEIIGQRILDILIKKSDQVPIKIIVDGVGTKDYIENIRKKIYHSKVELAIYKPFRFKFLFKSGYHRRDHRKIVLIDDLILYTGGMNIKDVFSRKIMHKERWRDTMIRIENKNLEIQSVFNQAKLDFLSLWRVCIKKFYYLQKKFQILYPFRNDSQYYLFSSLNRKRRLLFRKFYYNFLKEANSFIYLATPYFVPPLKLIKILKSKSEQGIEVQILTAGNTDVWLARQAGRAVYSTLLKSGIKIYEYTERIFHSKHTVTDKGVIIGSSNIDYRSFFHNLEIDFFISDLNFINKFRKIWNFDLQSCKEIILDEWEKRKILDKLSEKLSYLLRYYL